MPQETVTREFDDEQYKLKEGDEEGDTDLQTMERANELAKQYEEIKDRTLGDGLVAGRLEDIDTSPANNNINVLVDLPGEGNNKTFRFKKPKVWSREYDFVRWIHHYGYDADSFPNMLKGKCDVKVMNIGDEEYELYIPEENKYRKKVGDRFSGVRNYSSALVSAYRNEDNSFYIAAPLLFFHTIHSVLWITPLVGYGWDEMVAFGLAVVGYLCFFTLALVEGEFIKTKKGSTRF